MPAPETLAAFIASSLLLIVLPGPDILYVLAHSARNGFISGLAVVLGLCSGLICHTVAVALGVTLLIQESPFALTLIKVLGAGYLTYLAITLWPRTTTNANAAPALAALPKTALLLRGLMMNLSNPKIALFFLAFLPQFTTPESSAIETQLLLFGAAFTLLAFSVFSSLAWLASRAAKALTMGLRVQSYLQKATALLFVVIAARLLLSKIA